ncbi:FAD-binding oxidoreductase [Vibrio hannami]|uniref:FAD-binding oxidoreductase n=1 Tax=Vibrio hannami TaxID=2717094 RepID=UPI00240EFA40|nr:FAD-binding oxidoreductase [Vibrio hannami]MDG3085677.1 FAD-binding oxidoreductase [Vibrio hannami]
MFSKIIHRLSASNTPITVQGARTGLTGAGVPMGSHIMSMDNMNRILGLRQNSAGELFVHVEPGVKLDDLHTMVNSGFKDLDSPDEETQEVLLSNPDIENYFWPVDLLEGSATIGGIASTNASGVTSFKYGRAAQYIEGLRFVGESGNDIWVSRTGNNISDTQQSEVAGTTLLTQNDVLNAILGGEGMYGVITELSLKLIRKPHKKMGFLVFMRSESQLESFIDKCQLMLSDTPQSTLATVEFMDQRAIEAIKALGNQLEHCEPLPELPTDISGAVYIELHTEETQGIQPLASSYIECLQDLGIGSDRIWSATEDKEIQNLRILRYAAPRVANLLVSLNQQKCPSITKLFTDIRFEGNFSSVLQDYLRDLQDTHMPAMIYGQVLDNHLHVNLFPEDERQLGIAKRLLAHWAQKVRIQRGTLVGNHGIGKLKTEDSYPELSKQEIFKEQQLKAIFDQRGLFNPHNRSSLSKLT